ncbi:MAG: hypothetical protein AB7O68_14510 [Pirellulales bacterium]
MKAQELSLPSRTFRRASDQQLQLQCGNPIPQFGLLSGEDGLVNLAIDAHNR